MKHRRILLLLVLLAVTTGLVLIWPREPKEPVYQGKGLTQWIEEGYAQGSSPTQYSPASRENTRRALQAMGTNALPYLLYQLARKDPRWVESFKQWAYSHRMLRTQYQADFKRLWAINYGLHLLGPDAAPGLPVLATYVNESPRGAMAVSVMANCGTPALPYLLKALDSTNAEVWGLALNGIMLVHSGTNSPLPIFLRLMSHSNGWVRAKSAGMLGYHRFEPALVVPPLVRALSDPDLQVQLDAINSLGGIGEAAQPAIPELLRLMKDPASKSTAAASNALFRIAPATLKRAGRKGN